MITTNTNICKLCNSENTIITDFSEGVIVCSNCGYVVEDKIIDETLEIRKFSNENGGTQEDNNRVGGPTNPYLNGLTLSTKILVKDRRNPLSRYSHRGFESGNRSIIRGLEKIDELGSKLELLLSITNKSKDIYKEIIENRSLRGRSLDGIIAAIFYHVCRQCNANRSIQDIVNKLKIDKKEFVRCFKTIEPYMIKGNHKGNIEIICGLVTVFCNKLDYKGTFRSSCEEITRLVCEQELLAGKNPNTVAASCILYTSKLIKTEEVDRARLSEVSNMTLTTIHNALNEIIKKKDDITPIKYKHLIENVK